MIPWEPYKRGDYRVASQLYKTIPNKVFINKILTKLQRLDDGGFGKRDDLNNNELSIITPTFDNIKYIKETINSILTSTKKYKIEILVGIDNCEPTLNYIRQEYFGKNVKFYFFNEKNGPYIIRNTLVTLTNSPLLLFFDSDDIMKEGMIDELMEKIKHNDFVKPMYSEFKDKPNPSITKTSTFGEGQFIIRKELFLQMNGFEPWLVAADSDFMKRLYKNNKKFQYTNNVVFYKRVHPNSLTQHKETNFTSLVRHEYFKKIQTKKDFGPLSKLHTANYTILSSGFDYNSIISNQSLTPIKDNRELLNQILSQGKRVNQVIDYNKINEVLSKEVIPEEPKTQPKPNLPKDRNEILQLKKDSIIATNRKMIPTKPNRRNDLPNIFGKK